MKNLASLILISSTAMLGLTRAATVSISTMLPTVDGADIANDNGAVDAGGVGGGDLGHIWSNRPLQGQTFLTGSNIGGYQLTAVTLKNLNNTVGGGATFEVIVGAMAGSVLTQIGATESAVTPSYVPLSYITFTFSTALNLAANTQYGFLWDTSAAGFVTTNNLDDSTYTGGTGISSGAAGVPDLNAVTLRNVDRVFHVDLVAVPEPSSAFFGIATLSMVFRRRR